MLKFRKPNRMETESDHTKTEKRSKQMILRNSEDQPSVPEGVWIKCPKCGATLYKEDVVNNGYVCYKCDGYFRVKTKNRLRMVVDKHSFEEWDTGLLISNPLDFPGYEEKITQVQAKTKLNEAVC